MVWLPWRCPLLHGLEDEAADAEEMGFGGGVFADDLQAQTVAPGGEFVGSQFRRASAGREFLAVEIEGFAQGVPSRLAWRMA